MASQNNSNSDSLSDENKLVMYKALLYSLEGNVEKYNVILKSVGSDYPNYRRQLLNSEGEKLYKDLDNFNEADLRFAKKGGRDWRLFKIERLWDAVSKLESAIAVSQLESATEKN